MKKKEVTKELAIVKGSPANMMVQAMTAGMDLTKLEKFMELQAKWEANQAMKAYSEAMTAFKANPPEILKDKKVDYTTKTGNKVKYNHATLANVTNKIGQELCKQGLSASWITKQAENGVTVTCRISHVKGHFEETSLTAGIDSSGGKNDIQALGSTVSYLERYTLLALTGLATHEMDDDGKGGGEIKYIDDKQLSTLLDFIDSKNIDQGKFLSYMEADSIKNIPEKDYAKALAAVKAAKGKVK